MIPDCKITEIFLMCDLFNKNFDDIITNHLITEGYTAKKRNHTEVISIKS